MLDLRWLPEACCRSHRFFLFLKEKNPQAARRAAGTIRNGANLFLPLEVRHCRWAAIDVTDRKLSKGWSALAAVMKAATAMIAVIRPKRMAMSLAPGGTD